MSWRSARSSAAVIGLPVLAVLLVSGLGGPTGAAIAADAGPALGAGAAAVAGLVAARRCSGGYRRGWLLTALALASIAVGETLSLAATLRSGGALATDLRDATYLAVAGFGAAGVTSMLLGPARVPWARLGLDVALAASSMTLVSWILVVEPLSRGAVGLGLRPVYPLVDVGLGALAMVMVWRAPLEDRRWVGRFGGAVLVLSLADSAGSLSALHGSYEPGGLEAVFVGGLALMAVAAQQAGRPAQGGCAGAGVPGPPPLVALAPHLCFIAACLSVLGAGALSGRAPGPVDLVAGGVALVALFIRQGVLGREEARLHHELATREQRYRSLVQGSSDLIAVVGKDGAFTYISPSVRRVWGFEPEELVGAPMADFLHPDDQPAAASQVRRMLAPDWPGGPVRVRTRTQGADGRWRHMETAVSDHRDNPAVGGLVYNGRDVTEQVALQEQLGRLAFHDALTGLPNRARFLDRAEHALAQRPDDGLTPALLFLDLDGFKAVNDSGGHAAGDALLVACAARLCAAVRPGDTLARLGGDEFAALLERCEGPDQPLEVARRILDALADPFDLDGRRYTVTASIGAAMGGAHQGAEQVLRTADLAMYDAKAAGKGRVVLHAAALAGAPVVGPAQTPPPAVEAGSAGRR